MLQLVCLAVEAKNNPFERASFGGWPVWYLKLLDGGDTIYKRRTQSLSHPEATAWLHYQSEAIRARNDGEIRLAIRVVPDFEASVIRKVDIWKVDQITKSHGFEPLSTTVSQLQT